ncbi:hypothetical protein [Bradyrhizobium sp.]|uniref:hypothetical protein n=1 Tax=Bradyrhizobium sp. TaxID=376 RepID=UPI003C52B37A
MFDQAFAAADQSRWEQVAELINGFSPGDLSVFIQTYKTEPAKISQIYLGAIGNQKVGRNSQVALATKVNYLDFNFRSEIKKASWPKAAEYLNEFNQTDIVARLKSLNSESLKALHEGAVANPGLGVDSGAAKVSAQMLAQRSAQGDTKALLLPTITGQGKDALLQAIRPIDGILPSASGGFTIVVDGQMENLTAGQAEQIRAKTAAVLKDHLQRVQNRASMVHDRYQSQSEVDRKHWIVSPIVKTLGSVKDPGPDLLAYVTRADTDVKSALEAVGAGRFVQAAALLANAEGAAISADKMWQAYFQGIIRAGDMTVTVLEVTRDAAFLTLGIMATIATGGAAAGALGAVEGAGATTTVLGVEVGTATAANVIAIGAPILANVAEAAAKVSMGDKVDWGALVVDTLVQVVIARFGGKVTAGISKALLGNPATESLASRVTEKVVHAAFMHVGSTTLMSLAQDTYRAARGQAITWQTFVDDLITRLIDPKSLAIVAVTGALTSAAEAKYGGGPRGRTSPSGGPEGEPAASPKPARAPTPTAEAAMTPARAIEPPGTQTPAPQATGHEPTASPQKMATVTPIEAAKKGLAASPQLKPGPREVTSLGERRLSSGSSGRTTPPTEPHAQAKATVAEETGAEPLKIAAGAEGTGRQASGSPNAEPTVASASRGGGRGRPRPLGGGPPRPEYLGSSERPRLPTAREALAGPRTLEESLDELGRVPGITDEPPRGALSEAALKRRIGTLREAGDVEAWARRQPKSATVFGNKDMPPEFKALFPETSGAASSGPDAIAIDDTKKEITIFDATSKSSTAHVEKTHGYAERVKQNLPDRYKGYKVLSQEGWSDGGLRFSAKREH